MGPLAEAPGQEDFFLLSFGVVGQILFKLHPLKIQLPQDGFEQGLVDCPRLDKIVQTAPEGGGVLGNVGDHQSRGGGTGAALEQILPQKELEETALPAAVGSRQGQALPLLQGKGDGGTVPVPQYRLGTLRHHLGVVGQRGEFQALRLLQVLAQGGLFGDGLLLPGLDIFGPLHHLGRFMPHEAPVIGVAADLGCLHPVRPVRAPPGRLLEAADVFFQPGVLLQLCLLTALEVFKPGGEGPALDLDGGAVQGEDVIHTAVQEPAVVGDQDKTFLPSEIGRDQGTALGIQVVGGLVDEEEMSLVEEERRQQDLALLPAGEGGEGPLQDLRLHVQQSQLPQKFPFLGLRTDFLQDSLGELVFVRDGVGEVVKDHGVGDPALVFVLPLQQPQKGGFPPAVAAYEAQLPAAVQLEGDVVEDGVEAPGIGEAEVFYFDH